MLVDDMLVAESELPSGVNSIPMDPITGRLYLGGIPNGLDVAGKVAKENGLDGCVSDIIVNGK